MTNLYGYSFNDPINFVDINGKEPTTTAILVAGFISGGVTNAVMTYRNGNHDPKAIARAFVVGGAGGAIAGVGLAAGGVAAATGIAVSFMVDVGSQLLNNVGMFDNPTDYFNGIKSIGAGNQQLRQLEKESCK